MARQISSGLTPFYKYVFPGLFVVGFLNIVFNYPPGWFDGDPIFARIVPLMPAAFFVYSFLMYRRLKRVDMDDNNLYVSDHRTEAVIPISEIERVTEFVFAEPRKVTIHLKKPTVFGQKIVFLAPYRMFPFFRTPPIVSELKDLIGSKSWR